MGALYDAQWCRIVLECGAVYLAAVFLVSFLYEESFKKWRLHHGESLEDSAKGDVKNG